MGLISRVSSRTYRLPKTKNIKWPKFILTWKLEAALPEESRFSSTLTCQKQPKTFVPFALERKDLDIKGQVSIESLPNLCARVVILPITTELEENPSTAENSMTRTLSTSTPNLVF